MSWPSWLAVESSWLAVELLRLYWLVTGLFAWGTGCSCQGHPKAIGRSLGRLGRLELSARSPVSWQEVASSSSTFAEGLKRWWWTQLQKDLSYWVVLVKLSASEAVSIVDLRLFLFFSSRRPVGPTRKKRSTGSIWWRNKLVRVVKFLYVEPFIHYTIQHTIH
jgi:hypothetical protein